MEPDHTRSEKVRLTAEAMGIAVPAAGGPKVLMGGQWSKPNPPRYRPLSSGIYTRTRSKRAARALVDVLTCSYCGRDGTVAAGPDGKSWHMDHVVPLSVGGEDALWNIVKACATCNMRKAGKFWTPRPGARRAALAPTSAHHHHRPEPKATDDTDLRAELAAALRRAEIAEHRRELAEHDRDAARAVATERAESLADLRVALRVLAAGPQTPTPAPSTEPSSPPSAPPPRRRWWARGG